MKNALFLLAALALTSAAQAQTAPTAPAAPLNRAGRSPEQQAEVQAQRLAKELNLNADQQAKVQQIMAAQRQETQAAIQSAGGNRRAMGQAMRAGRDKTNEQFKAVLTPDQYTKYQQLTAQRREQMRERRQGGGMGSDIDGTGN